MKGFLAMFAVMWLVAVTSSYSTAADLTVLQGNPRGHLDNLRPENPGEDANRYSIQRRLRPDGHRQHRPHYDYRRAPLRPVPPPHVWPCPYPYPPYYPYCPPPLYIPAEELYGPQATARFLGWNTFNRRGPVVNPIVPDGNAQRQGKVLGNEGAEGNRNLRGTNEKALSLAWKFIGYGDAYFSEQKYSDAYQRYRKAVQAAPQLAAGHLRQGYALAAAGRYELASKALKHGLALDPGWPASGFRNDELFGWNQLAKTAHLRAMTEAVEREPHDADLMFLLAVYFHFEGNPERAGIFFRRAGELVGGNDAHLKAFMGR